MGEGALACSIGRDAGARSRRSSRARQSGGAGHRRAVVQGAGRGDPAALRWRLPFKTSGKDVTKRAALAAMLSDLAGEEKAARAPAVEVYTTAGLRAAIGKLPANVDDGSGNQLYALASNSPRDALILILSKRTGDWRPIGLFGASRFAPQLARVGMPASAPVGARRKRRANPRRSSRSSRAPTGRPASRRCRWSSRRR